MLGHSALVVRAAFLRAGVANAGKTTFMVHQSDAPSVLVYDRLAFVDVRVAFSAAVAKSSGD